MLCVHFSASQRAVCVLLRLLQFSTSSHWESLSPNMLNVCSTLSHVLRTGIMQPQQLYVCADDDSARADDDESSEEAAADTE